MRVAPDGSTSGFSEQGTNEIVVDAAGRIYLDGFDGAFSGGDGMPDPDWIRLLDPAGGDAREVVSDIAFPNGMVVTADGATLVPQGAVVRVLDGGEITHRVQTDLPCFSCAVGGPEGRHLFLLCNEFEGVEAMPAVLARRSARVYVTEIG